MAAWRRASATPSTSSCVYDETGQLLNASFMDYLLPTAIDVPRIEVGHEETPSPLNPIGVKGAGEAGAIPVGALFAQALEDALSEPGLEIKDIPSVPAGCGSWWNLVAAQSDARNSHFDSKRTGGRNPRQAHILHRGA